MWFESNSEHPLTALITGGSVGLGLAMARDLASAGWRVFICARTEADLKAAVEHEPRLTAIHADVTSEADRTRMFAEIARQTGGRPLDCLINNAAIVQAHDYQNPFTLKADRARLEIEINLAAPIEMIRLYLARRQDAPQTKAAIVNVGTPGALFPLDANLLYSATKSGLHMFTLGLRRHLAGSVVKVIEVFPPALDTGLARQLDVASQAANGPDVIAAVARETVAGILDGVEIIRPHAEARQICAAFPDPDPAFVEQINAGVKRRAGWDSE